MKKTRESPPRGFYIFISSSTMRIAIYARKSTETEDRQVQSLDDQLRILNELARRDGHTVVEVISESKSAKEPGRRPGFQSLLELIQSGKIDGILTWHINRLTRNLVDGGVIAHLLSSGKLQMIRTPERSFRSEDNVLLLAIENGVATSYLHDLSKAVRRGMDSKAAKGWKPGQAPIGYLNDWESREIKIDPVRAPLVHRGFEMLMSGSYSVAQIWRELSRLGLTGKSRSRRGKPVSRVAIHNMLRNPFYAGHLTYKGEIMAGAHPALLKPGEFELAQMRLQRIANPKHRSEVPPAFAGVFTCKECRAAVVYERKKKKLSTGESVTYGYYHCSGSRGCRRLSLQEQPIAELTRAFVDSLAISRSFADWCLKAVRNCALEEQSEFRESLEETRSNLNTDQKRLDTLTMKYIDGEVEQATYHRMKDQLEQDIEKRLGLLARLEDQESIVLAHIKQKLEAGVQASAIGAGDSNYRKSVLISLGAGHLLDGKQLELRPDPILQKIASFEPGETSSHSVKSDDFVPDSQVWWSLVDDIRNIAHKTASFGE